MFLTSAARTGANAARTAVRLVAGAGTHVAWWVDYKVGGRPRDEARAQSPQRKR